MIDITIRLFLGGGRCEIEKLFNNSDIDDEDEDEDSAFPAFPRIYLEHANHAQINLKDEEVERELETFLENYSSAKKGWSHYVLLISKIISKNILSKSIKIISHSSRKMD